MGGGRWRRGRLSGRVDPFEAWLKGTPAEGALGGPAGAGAGVGAAVSDLKAGALVSSPGSQRAVLRVSALLNAYYTPVKGESSHTSHPEGSSATEALALQAEGRPAEG